MNVHFRWKPKPQRFLVQIAPCKPRDLEAYTRPKACFPLFNDHPIRTPRHVARYVVERDRRSAAIAKGVR